MSSVAILSAALPVKSSFEKGIDALVGGILILATAAFSSSYVENRKKLNEVQQLDPKAKETLEKVQEVRSKVIMDGFNAFGMGASTIGWAFTVRILPPVAILSTLFNGIGYVAGFAGSGLGVAADLKQYKIHAGDALQQRLDLIDIASKVSSMAWAILGTATLFTGVASSPFVGVLLIASVALAFAQGFYKQLVKQRS